MPKVLKIFDPKEKPFGKLSNNYKHEMWIDNEKWNSVTSYILASMLKNPMHKLTVQQSSNSKEAKANYDIFRQNEFETTVKRALDTGLEVKFQDQNLAIALVETGTRPIWYNSEESILGIGNNQQGKNLYGRALEQRRHVLQIAYKNKNKEIEKKQKEGELYDSYITYQGLISALRNGNDIKQFAGRTPAQILSRLGREKIERKFSSRDAIISLINNKRISDKKMIYAMKHPEIMVPLLRKDNLAKLRFTQIRKRNEIVFDMYADYLLEKNFESLKHSQYEKAKAQQFAVLRDAAGIKEKIKLEDRLYELYLAGYLSSRLSDAIEARLGSDSVVSEEDVKEATELVLDIDDDEKAGSTSTSSGGQSILSGMEQYLKFILPGRDEKEDIKMSKGEPVLVNPGSENVPAGMERYLDFRPLAISMMRIDGRYFPTISHYLSMKVMEIIPGVSTNEAYNQILVDPEEKGEIQFNNFKQIYDIQEIINNYTTGPYLIKHATTALNTKFQDRTLQNLLLATENIELIWADRTFPVLGVAGKNSGYKGKTNFVGKHLMKLRSKYKEERKYETIDQLTADDVVTVLEKDPFMHSWFKMRLRDMCKVLKTMQNYIYQRNDIDTQIDGVFTKGVLDIVYQPCSQLFGASDKINAYVPRFFREEINKCNGFNKVSSETVEILWQRIAIMMYYLIEYIEDSGIQNIRTVLGQIELLVSDGAQCVDVIDGEAYDNCIASALLNLINGISKFNKKFSYNYMITSLDVKTAASIILNADISDEDITSAHSENSVEGVFDNIDNVENVHDIEEALSGAIELVKTYPMIKKIKHNRINFFATQKRV